MRLDVGAIELRTLSDDYEDPGRPEDDWVPEPEPPGAIRRLVDRPVRVWGAVPEPERSVERRACGASVLAPKRAGIGPLIAQGNAVRARCRPERLRAAGPRVGADGVHAERSRPAPRRAVW